MVSITPLSIKMGATRLGITITEYEDKLKANLKWCFSCQQWQPRSDFFKDNSRSDKLRPTCRAASKLYSTYIPYPERKRRKNLASITNNQPPRKALSLLMN